MKDEEKYLEDEMEKFGERWPYPASFDGSDKDWVDELAEECAKHFYELGRKDEREQMLKDAVECVVCAGMEGDKWIMTYIGDYESMLKTCKAGDRVRILVLKAEEENK